MPLHVIGLYKIFGAEGELQPEIHIFGGFIVTSPFMGLQVPDLSELFARVSAGLVSIR